MAAFPDIATFPQIDLNEQLAKVQQQRFTARSALAELNATRQACDVRPENATNNYSSMSDNDESSLNSEDYSDDDSDGNPDAPSLLHRMATTICPCCWRSRPKQRYPIYTFAPEHRPSRGKRDLRQLIDDEDSSDDDDQPQNATVEGVAYRSDATNNGRADMFRKSTGANATQQLIRLSDDSVDSDDSFNPRAVP
eukprot:TRINITY_DN8218_c0_g1_i2.p3 TRINITY_DN8218_c0_g1~~TRINITY_DN8218_c0_g1_i2.p3  ORF type:complete len:195 (+),score=27.86 TRINITY_DN8218_c0_g1_i2:3538-4122(+)